MSPANHIRAADIFAELATGYWIDATCAEEHGDKIAAREEEEGRAFALAAEQHHRDAAQAAAEQFPINTCDCQLSTGTCHDCRED